MKASMSTNCCGVYAISSVAEPMSYQRTRLSSRPQLGASGEAFTCRLDASPRFTWVVVDAAESAG